MSSRRRPLPDLRRTLIQNFDARWEWYPASGEILSMALFAKRFQDPIERVYLATSGTRVVTFLNAGNAENYGVELEARKGLGMLGERFEPLTAFTNVTLMKSEIRIGEDALASKLDDERAMVGQAPYVVNAGMTYSAGSSGASATLLYNVVGKRIVSASEAPLPNVFEQPRHMLDFSLRVPVTEAISAKLDARNLLDSPTRSPRATWSASRTGAAAASPWA